MAAGSSPPEHTSQGLRGNGSLASHLRALSDCVDWCADRLARAREEHDVYERLYLDEPDEWDDAFLQTAAHVEQCQNDYWAAERDYRWLEQDLWARQYDLWCAAHKGRSH